MDDYRAALDFLKLLGLNAEVLEDGIVGKLIMIDNASYEMKRRQIDAWFTCVRQIGNHSYFTVRLRGTGNTL